MQIIPIKTEIMYPPKDDLWDKAIAVLPQLQERDIICISSKVIAIDEGRCIHSSKADIMDIVEQEADYLLPDEADMPEGYDMKVTLKDHTLISQAGIDQTNANKYMILWPKDSMASAKKWHDKLCAHFNLQELGVIITDSITLPMRMGVTGISLGFYGISPFRDYCQTEDLFDRTMIWTKSNIVDGVAAAAVLVKGEGTEITPIAIVRDVNGVEYTTEKIPHTIAPESDFYRPLLEVFKTRGIEGGHGNNVAIDHEGNDD